MTLDLAKPYRLHPQVALRPETFGALAYHYGNRRLSLLRAPELVALVEGISDHPSVADALAASPISLSRHPSFTKALASLERSSFLVARATDDEPHELHERHELHELHEHGGTPPAPTQGTRGTRMGDQLKAGLNSPICLTWEWTYACNLQCVHCLSSSGTRDPNELSTADMKRIVDDLCDLQVFYINVGGGEPMLRPDFFELVDHCVSRGVGVKFSTNGGLMTADKARRLASMDYVDIQISLDGIDTATNDAVRGGGSFAKARRAMEMLHDAGREGTSPFKISVVMTRDNVPQIDAFEALADKFGAELRLTRFRPSGRGAESWDALHPTQDQQRVLYRWLLDRPHVLTGDSFFHLSALGEALPGLNLCGAGRVVCLIDPVGDVYACPFVLHPEFLAGSVHDEGGFGAVWRTSELFVGLREPQSPGACSSCGSYDACQGGCMATKFFTGLSLDDPDPECVWGNADGLLLDARAAASPLPSAGADHSWAPVALGRTRRTRRTRLTA